MRCISLGKCKIFTNDVVVKNLDAEEIIRLGLRPA